MCDGKKATTDKNNLTAAETMYPQVFPTVVVN